MIIQHSIEVDYTCEQMFKLVANYEQYPLFIKNCTKSTTCSQGDNQVLAELEMSIAGIKQSFSTITTFFPVERITMELANGPFKKLHGTWEFINQGTINNPHCKVQLYMDYELSSILEFMIGNKFTKSITNMVDSFVARAVQEYGNEA